MKLKVVLHSAVRRPHGAHKIDWGSVTVRQGWSVYDLAKHLEDAHFRDLGCALQVVMLMNTARAHALPFHEPCSELWDAPDGTVVVVGELHMASAAEGRPEGGVEASPSQAARKKLIPVTILTGFLGAGKTTLLNRLLFEQQHKKVAVIENEFGEVAIDQELLSSKLSLAEQVVVMDNGCMCCTIRGDLLGAFDQVARKVHEGNPLDSVLIETTGMADPVPIVRTFLQTPAITDNFRLDGVVTLVDSKNILNRLKEMDDRMEANAGVDSNGTVDEAFQQITYADRVILNKIDLVSGPSALEVWERIRQINPDAKVRSCVRGQLHPAELMDLGAFDLRQLQVESEFLPDVAHDESAESCCDDEGHCHDHGHSSEEHGHDEGHCDKGHCCDQGHGHDEEHSHDHHDHSTSADDLPKETKAASKHATSVGTFSVTYPNMEVELLAFARWVRTLSMKPPEAGVLYRCKAIVAVAGSHRKMAFHVVSDVAEKEEVGDWGPDEQRGCKIVFIGRSLDRDYFETAFAATLRPVRHPLRCASGLGPPGSDLLQRLHQQAEPAFFRVLAHLTTTNVGAVGMTAAPLSDAVFGVDAAGHYKALVSHDPQAFAARHPRDHKAFYLHTLLSMPSASVYIQAARAAKLDVASLFGLTLTSPAEAEAAGVTWLEVCDIADEDARLFVQEFAWRPETIQTFLSDPKNSTHSGMARVEYEYEDSESMDDGCDTLKFKMILQPDEEMEQGAASTLSQHRMVIQQVGGRSASQVYQLSFHSIAPTFQLHIPVPDHRVPLFTTKESFHKWHPFMDTLREKASLLFLIRMKPDGSGPLDDMCGCC